MDERDITLGVKLFIDCYGVLAQVWEQDEALREVGLIAESDDGSYQIRSATYTERRNRLFYVRGRERACDYYITHNLVRDTLTCKAQMKLIDVVNNGANKVRVLEV